MKKDDQEQVRLAYHEAGHAAMVLIVGGAVHWVTLIPSKKFDAHTNATTFSPSAAVLVALSGDACERIRFRHASRGAHGDYATAAKKIAPSRIPRYIDVAKALLQLHWKGVEALAQELLRKKKMTGAEARNAFTVPGSGEPS